VKKQVKLKVRRLGSLAKGLQSLNDLKIPNVKFTLEVADTINVVQEVIEGYVAQEEEIKKDVVERAQNPVVTATEQVKLNPDAEIRSKMIEIGNQDIVLDVYEIDATLLFQGETKPVPGAVAALLPLLVNVDKVETEVE
jgi:hypothetical protein